MVSIWYSHPKLYDLGMKLIHGKNYGERYIILSRMIKPNSSVLDIGCGSCKLSEYLKNCRYMGWDLNKYFIRYGKRRGLSIQKKDFTKAVIPKTDYIVVSDVIHHVHPNDEAPLRRAFKAANKGLIVVEPFNDPKAKSRKTYRLLREFRRKTFLEKLFGEEDGTNDPGGIYIRNRKELADFLNKIGKAKTQTIGDEMIAFFPKVRK